MQKMIRIKDFSWNDVNYEVYLTEDTKRKAQEIGLHEGIFLGATARLVSRIEKQHSTYYYAEQNILFDVEIKQPNKLYFLDMKRLNIFENKWISGLKDAINDIKEPEFFRSYPDGRKVYLNKCLLLELKKLSIPPHFISLANVFVPEGPHSMFYNDVVIDFDFVKVKTNKEKKFEEHYYITNITKPDFVNFGLMVLKN
ncbi:hypothetical protein ACFC4S_23790 [Priestia megaterium]|uniref:hypothetical protein n=1 Tax=Priestia megaterium TaxID=1404 RepID=UPI0035D6687C